MAVLIRTMDDIGLPRPDLGLGLALSWILGAFHRLGGGALHGSWMGLRELHLEAGFPVPSLGPLGSFLRFLGFRDR